MSDIEGLNGDGNRNEGNKSFFEALENILKAVNSTQNVFELKKSLEDPLKEKIQQYQYDPKLSEGLTMEDFEALLVNFKRERVAMLPGSSQLTRITLEGKIEEIISVARSKFQELSLKKK